MELELRPLVDADLDRIFEWEQDPDAVAMAAFTRADPTDRDAFDLHHRRIRADPDAVVRAIEVGGVLSGTIGSFTRGDEREITYWIDPDRWGRGLATAAVGMFVESEPVRPLFARVAEHNVGSATVLVRAGFVAAGSDTGFADGLGREVVEHIYRLDRPPATGTRPTGGG